MTTIGPINMGNLPNYLLFFADGRNGANWQGASKGFVGDVAIDGLQAGTHITTSGFVPYAGTIYSNAPTLGAWQKIVDDNAGQASGVTGDVARIAGLQADLISAFNQINALPASPGFASVSSTSLNGLNTQNGHPDVTVINVTSGFQVSSKIYITGDPEDVFILRWDSDLTTPGYQGEVKFQSGGAIVPLGGLKTTNFINVAGDINSSGGGTTPPPPYPQGPRYDDGLGPLIIGGQDFNGGGFFTGYWLTTGVPTMFDPTYGEWIGLTHSLSNAIFAGGWYTFTTDFSMTSGTSGVWVSPPAAPGVPSITVKKYVSVTGPGGPFYDADTPPGPTLISPTNPVFRYVVTNTGGVPLTNVTLTDSVLGSIILPTPTLAVGASTQVDVTGTFAEGQQFNNATASGVGNGITVNAENPAYYVGAAAGIEVTKDVWNGTAYVPADFPPGPYLPPSIAPQFRFTVTNPSSVTLTNVTLTDDVYGLIANIGTVGPGVTVILPTPVIGTWAPGEHHNIATATGQAGGVTYTASNPAYWTGAANAALTIQKLVGGLTTPPCPVLNPDVPPEYTFIVTNTGGAPLAPVTVTDSVLGSIGSVALMNPGDVVTFTATGTWTAGGPHTNTATVTGTFNGVDYTATADACFVGNTPPTVQIVSPACGTVVSGTVPLHIMAQDAECLARVDLYIDGLLVHTETVPAGGLTADFTYSWDTTTVAIGPHTVEAVATDCNGLTATVTCTFLVGAPALTIQKLINGAVTPPCLVLNPNVPPVYTFIVTNTGGAPLAPVTVTDIVLGPIGTVPLLNPGEVATFTKTGIWAAGGPFFNTVTATGTFNGVNYTATDEACFVGNTPPAVHIVSPPCGTVVSGLVPLHITAQDAECLAKVDLYIDGQLVYTDSLPAGAKTTDFIYNWDTSMFSEGPHVVTAVATDCAGLTATATCTYTVNNLPECFKQILVNDNLIIPPQKPDVETVIGMEVIPSVTKVRSFTTIDGTKFVVSGVAEIDVTYAALDEQQTEHFAHFMVPFSAVILCPQLGTNVEVEPVIMIEHVQWHLVDRRTIKKFIVMLVGIRQK